MTDTETPRTNEAERTAPWPLSGQQGAWKFARTLERELIGAQAKLEAITEAIGTRDGHSSVPHVIALKATIAEQAEEIERLRDGLSGLLGLFHLLYERDDAPPWLREIALTNHRAQLARRLLMEPSNADRL